MAVAQLKELIGGIELKLDEEATATLDSASAWKEAYPAPARRATRQKPEYRRRAGLSQNRQRYAFRCREA
ncbi:MAG TPA: hypothetical protein VJB16_03640 [archaeon]|nr:hypothetical protein [archaeon]